MRTSEMFTTVRRKSDRHLDLPSGSLSSSIPPSYPFPSHTHLEQEGFYTLVLVDIGAPVTTHPLGSEPTLFLYGLLYTLEVSSPVTIFQCLGQYFVNVYRGCYFHYHRANHECLTNETLSVVCFVRFTLGTSLGPSLYVFNRCKTSISLSMSFQYTFWCVARYPLGQTLGCRVPVVHNGSGTVT